MLIRGNTDRCMMAARFVQLECFVPNQDNVAHSHRDGLRFIGWEGNRSVHATVSGLKVGSIRHTVFASFAPILKNLHRRHAGNVGTLGEEIWRADSFFQYRART